MPLNVEAVVASGAVEAQLLPADETDPVGARYLTAARAAVRVEELRLLRQRDGRGLDIEQVGRLLRLIVGERFLARHPLRPRPEHQAHGLARGAVIKRKCLLAAHVKQQVALADAAAEQRLNGVHAAGIVFRDAHDLLGNGKVAANMVDIEEKSTVILKRK